MKHKIILNLDLISILDSETKLGLEVDNTVL